MRVAKELLAKNNQEIEKKKKRLTGEDADEDVESHTRLMPMPEIYTYLNTQSDAFDSKLNHGINNDPSVFDKYAVFRTGGEET